MITMRWTCSMCGKEESCDIDLEGVIPSIEGAILYSGWKIQRNGDNTDVYCSKKCAE